MNVWSASKVDKHTWIYEIPKFIKNIYDILCGVKFSKILVFRLLYSLKTQSKVTTRKKTMNEIQLSHAFHTPGDV